MPRKPQQNPEDQPESLVTAPAKTGQPRSETISGDDFVKAMTSIRRSFHRLKDAVASGNLEAMRKAVQKLGRGLDGVEARRRG